VSAHVQSILQNREIWAANAGCSNVSKGYLMATGTVKWFNNQKGFGFIQPESGGSDVFVHISAVERAGMSTLNEGQRVSYDVVNERGKSAAANLKSA
jgi:CspA family cold shock protein